MTDMSVDAVERFRRGLVVSTAPGFAEANPEIIQQWLQFRAQNPIEPVPYQAQMAIGLGLISEEACFEKRLESLKMPTLILFGTHDKVVPAGNAGLLARQIPDSTVCILADAGHFFPMEKPAEAVKLIIDFLNPK
jgi:3-oxoadipate enol-lactonase